MKFRYIALATLASATVALAACGGGGHALPSTSANGGTVKPSAKAQATLSVFIPKATASAAKHRAFVSPSTKGILVAAFTSPYNTGAVPNASGAFDVSGSSPNCAPAVSGGGSTCTFNISVPAGKDDFIVTTYDTAPVNNKIPAGAQRLGYGMLANQTIASGQANTISIALGGVVTKVTLSLPQTASSNWSCTSAVSCSLLHATNMVTQTATVNAWDAKGNMIVSDGWYDVNGNPVSITVSADTTADPSPQPGFTPNPALGFNTPMPSPLPSSTPGAPTLSATVNSPAANQFIITYDPTKMAYSQFVNGFGTSANGNAATLTAVASNGATSGTATIALTSSVFENPIPAASPAVSSPTYMKVSPKDHKLWVAMSSGAAIMSFDTNAQAFSQPYYASNAGATVKQLLPLSDGSVWFVEQGNGGSVKPQLAKLPYPVPSAAPYVIESPLPVATPTANYPVAIAQAFDNSLWLAEATVGSSMVARVDPSTMTTTLNVPPLTYNNGNPGDIAASPDGKTLWVSESRAPTPTFSYGSLYQIDATTSTLVNHWTVPTAGSSEAISAIAVDPTNGTVWVGESGIARLTSFNPTGQTWGADYPAGPVIGTGVTRLNGSVQQILVAADHSIWATENAGKIAHLVPGSNPPATATLQEFTLTSGGGAFGIVADPSGDGSIWYVATSKNLVAHLIP